VNVTAQFLQTDWYSTKAALMYGLPVVKRTMIQSGIKLKV
jgi:hypothetical protein